MASKVTACEAGTDEFTTKPVHPEELKLKIEALLGKIIGINGKV
jgi:DNA-binding response OmpR family regulator